MKILIYGGTGMLGHKLFEQFKIDHEVWVTIRKDFPSVAGFGIFDRERIIENCDVETGDPKELIERLKPEVVINAVGIIKQLPTSKNTLKTLRVNSIFPLRLGELAETYNFKLVNIGTDCVFNGDKGNYAETDTPDALDLYGQSKHHGEAAGKNCLTLRTSIIGRELGTAHSLVEWFLSNAGGRVKGFVNAIYSGFPTVVLAQIIKNVLINHPQLEGLYQVASPPISKYELLHLINRAFDARITIEPETEFRLDRSLNGEKFAAATGFVSPDWTEMIEVMARDAAATEKIRSRYSTN